MILPLKTGGQLVLGECPWIPAAYLSAGNMRGSHGVMLNPAELDKAIAELMRIRAALKEREPKRRAA